MTAHSPLGPSSADRWLNCPGSVLASQGVTEVESEYALEGTAAHSLAEKCRALNQPAKKFLGGKIFVERQDKTQKSFEVTPEMVAGVQDFLDFVNALPGNDFNEAQVSYAAWVPEGFGTMDSARGNDGTVYITDLKFGKGVQVWAKDNSQLKLYALGFYHDYGWLYDIETFHLTVHQPRLDHVDEWDISLVDLLRWADEVIRPTAAIALQPGAPFKAGTHCKFCKLKFTCDVRTKWVLEQVTGDQASEFENLEAFMDKLEPRKADRLGGVLLAKALSAIDAIESWCKDVAAHAMREIQQGKEVGDWKLVEGRSKRKWIDGDTVIAGVLKAEGLKEEMIYTKKLITPPAAEKLVGKKNPIMKAYVRKPPGRPKLAPGDDPRPAMTMDALREFEDLSVDDDDDDL